MEINLAAMTKGQRGKVSGIRDRGAFNRRIRDMGVIPGVEISFEGAAPLGDPINVKVRGMSLALRNNEAEKIFVELSP